MTQQHSLQVHSTRPCRLIDSGSKLPSRRLHVLAAGPRRPPRPSLVAQELSTVTPSPRLGLRVSHCGTSLSHAASGNRLDKSAHRTQFQTQTHTGRGTGSLAVPLQSPCSEESSAGTPTRRLPGPRLRRSLANRLDRQRHCTSDDPGRPSPGGGSQCQWNSKST